MSVWSVYVIRCGDNSLYTGIATDVRRRLREHESGRVGAKYLRGRAPLELVFEKSIGERSVASKIEHRIKRLPRTEKQQFSELPAKIDKMIRDFSLSSSQ